MTHQDDLHQADAPQDQPTMELLDGAEVETPQACCSIGHRIVRGSLYGVLVLSATALLAISAVPELTNYVPEFGNNSLFASSNSSCALSTAHCTALALGKTASSPCSPSESAVVFEEKGCSKSCKHSNALASVSVDAGSCCKKEGSSCCKDEASCPLAAAAELVNDTPKEQALGEEALAKLPVGEDIAPLTETEKSESEAAESEAADETTVEEPTVE